MYHMAKYQLNCLKHISFVTDGVQYHLLIKNCIRASLLAKKTMDFYCYFSHCFRLKRHLPHSVVESFKSKINEFFNGV